MNRIYLNWMTLQKFSLEYSIDELLILLQFHLLIPMFFEKFSCSLLFHYLEFILLTHILFRTRRHLLSNFEISHFFELFFYLGLFDLVLDFILDIIHIGIHATSLLTRLRNLMNWQIFCNVFIFFDIKLLLVFEHLFEECWLIAAVEVDNFRLNFLSLIPFYLLIPIILIRIEHLFFMENFE